MPLHAARIRSLSHSAEAHAAGKPRASDVVPGQEQPTPTRIVLLDALRGAAALIVLLHHARSLFPAVFRRLHDSSPVLDTIVLVVSRRNVEAVWGFFVLSGLSIRLSVERRSLHSPGGMREYFERRARRILPLYWLALAASWWVARYVAATPNEALSSLTLLGNLLFLQSASGVAGQWFVPYAANGPLWSLSFEAFFYLAYPLLIFATGPSRRLEARRRRIACVATACCVGHLLNLVIPTPLSLFLAASLVWYIGVEVAERRIGYPSALPWPAILGAFTLVCAFRFAFGWLELHGLVVGIGALMVAECAHSRGQRPNAPALAFLAWFGNVSYALYLLHVPIMRAVSAIWGQTPAALAWAVGLSVLMSWFAERSAQRLFAPRRG